MTTEEQIKQKAFELHPIIHYDENLDKYNTAARRIFADGANFGREIGMKEAFDWIPVSERLPEVKDHPYTVMVTDKPHDHFGILILPIHNTGSVEYIEISWKFWRPIKFEDML